MNLCVKHGGNIELGNSFLCDICSTRGINKCPCGGIARIFGEALMSHIQCEICKASLIGIGIIDIKDRWNNGERGAIEMD